MALRASGRLMVSVAMWPSTSSSTGASDMKNSLSGLVMAFVGRTLAARHGMPNLCIHVIFGCFPHFFDRHPQSAKRLLTHSAHDPPRRRRPIPAVPASYPGEHQPWLRQICQTASSPNGLSWTISSRTWPPPPSWSRP